jgi:ubiquinone/menaquinone biosynthesis C-methylase UbiE
VSEFHFVRDYERLVADLIAAYPFDEAMSRAVGGNYDAAGALEQAVLQHVGLCDGMSLVDLGCGSGRLACAVARDLAIDYCGIDVVQELLDYAATRTPKTYRFILNRSLDVPLPTSSADMVAAFSLFTHLRHAETYLYMREALRILRPGGRLVFSFLELAEPTHWPIFAGTVEDELHGRPMPLNQFVERNVIDLWAAHLGYVREYFVDPTRQIAEGIGPFGQSLAVLRR